MKYICELCGRIYDEERGEPLWRIGENTSFDSIPPYVTCPDCGSEKEAFYPVKAGNKMQPMADGKIPEVLLKTQKSSER